MYTHTSIMVHAYSKATDTTLQDAIKHLGIDSLVTPEDIQRLSSTQDLAVKSLLNNQTLISQWTKNCHMRNR